MSLEKLQRKEIREIIRKMGGNYARIVDSAVFTEAVKKPLFQEFKPNEIRLLCDTDRAIKREVLRGKVTYRIIFTPEPPPRRPTLPLGAVIERAVRQQVKEVTQLARLIARIPEDRRDRVLRLAKKWATIS